MSGREPSVVSSAASEEGIGRFEQVLDVVRRGASDLLTDVLHWPSVLRVRAGDVAVELEWHPEAAGGLPVRATAPAARTTVNGSATATAWTGPHALPAPVSPDSSASPESRQATSSTVLTAPMVGVFYIAPEPGAKPLVCVGDQVAVGQQVAIIEAMKLMVPVQADRPGVVVEVLQPDGTPVEYGDPLFAIAPSAAA